MFGGAPSSPRYMDPIGVLFLVMEWTASEKQLETWHAVQMEGRRHVVARPRPVFMPNYKFAKKKKIEKWMKNLQGEAADDEPADSK